MLHLNRIKVLQVLLTVYIVIYLTGSAGAATFPSTPEGSINFYKHTGPPDDSYTASPSTASACTAASALGRQSSNAPLRASNAASRWRA